MAPKLTSTSSTKRQPSPTKDRTPGSKIEGFYPYGHVTRAEMVKERDRLREGLKASSHAGVADSRLILEEEEPSNASMDELMQATAGLLWAEPKLRDNLRSLADANETLKAELSSTQAQVHDLSTQLETADRRSSSLLEELQAARQHVQVLQSTNAQGGQELEGAQRSVEQLQAENRQLREANADLSERCLSKDVAEKVAEKLLKGERYRELAYMERDIKLQLMELFREMDVNCWPAIRAGLDKTEERQRQREARRAESSRSRRPSPIREG